MIVTTKEALHLSYEREKLFSEFSYSLLTFLIHVCRGFLNHYDGRRVEYQKLETNIVDSLTLMWQMHVTTFSMKSYYKMAGYIKDTHLTFNYEQSKLVVPQLQKMNVILNYCPFIEKTRKRYCLVLIEQMKNYYKPHDYIMAEADSYKKPWLASKVQLQQQMFKKAKG